MPQVLYAFLLAGGIATPMFAAAQTGETQTPTVPAQPGQSMARAPVAVNPPGHSGVIVPPQTDKSINVPATRGGAPIVRPRHHRHSIKGQTK